MLCDTEDWVVHQMKNKDERMFAGERSEIKLSTLYKWRWYIYDCKQALEDQDLETGASVEGPKYKRRIEKIFRLYNLGLMKWPIGRIKKRAYAVKKSQEQLKAVI